MDTQFVSMFRCAAAISALAACGFAHAQFGSTSPQPGVAIPPADRGQIPMPAAQDAAAQRAALQAAQTVPGSMPLNSLNSIDADYRLGPNDLMDVEVFGIPDLKRTVRVNGSGFVSLALIGNISVNGLTAQQAEVLIASKYSERFLQNPQISVFIREFTTQRITIEGAVSRPGIYPLTGQITLLRAIALAGGGAQLADLKEIMVFRSSPNELPQTTKYNLEDIRSGKTPDPLVKAEDVIVVKRDPVRAAIRDSLFRDVLDTINPLSYIPK